MPPGGSLAPWGPLSPSTPRTPGREPLAAHPLPSAASLPGAPDVGSGDAGSALSPGPGPGPSPSRQARAGGAAGARLQLARLETGDAARIPPQPQECSPPRAHPTPARAEEAARASRRATATAPGPGRTAAAGQGLREQRRPNSDSLPAPTWTGDKDTHGAREAEVRPRLASRGCWRAPGAPREPPGRPGPRAAAGQSARPAGSLHRRTD